MECSNKLFLVSTCLCLLFLSGCRSYSRHQEINQQTFEGETIMVSHDGKTYSKHTNKVIFTFSPDQVSYLFKAGDKFSKKDFKINSSKWINGECYYYADDVSNIFVLNERRNILRIYGSDGENNGILSHAGHTFLDLKRVSNYNNLPLLTNNN